MSKVKTAIISVSDKTGIIGFALKLRELGVDIFSTGGTAKALEGAGVEVTEVSAYTGSPEMMDGRVKTLHPKIHGGILARRDNPADMEAMSAHGMKGIDMVVVNLYPFEKTVAREDVTFEEAIENIDIGGPTMLRAAAKNHKDVAVLIDPADYDGIINELKGNSGDLNEKTRVILAQKVFSHTSRYDGAIRDYLSKFI